MTGISNSFNFRKQAVLCLIAMVLLAAKTELKAQEELNYDHPSLALRLLKSSEDTKDLTIGKLTKVDVSKLKFEAHPDPDSDYKYKVDIDIFVLRDLKPEGDFMLLIYYPYLGWSLLNGQKEGLSKSFNPIKDADGVGIGIMQNNANLDPPITKRGKYYLRLLAKDLPDRPKEMYLYVCAIEQK